MELTAMVERRPDLGRVACASAAAVFSLFGGAHPGRAQIPQSAVDLIVRVEAFRPGDPDARVGSGFVVGTGRGRTYMVTAGHVVRNAYAGGVAGAPPTDTGTVQVSFQQDRSTRVATVERWVDAELDLAVISIPGTGSFDLHRLGSVEQGDRVYPMGCGISGPGCWTPPPPDVVASVAGDTTTYLSRSTFEGNSGGPLMNRWGEVVGVILARERTTMGNALEMDFVLSQLEAWNIGIEKRLGAYAAVRAGPRWSLQLMPYRSWGQAKVLRAGGGGDVGQWADRPGWSGRISLSRRLGARPIGGSASAIIAGHLAAVRLTADNLSVTAGMVGLQATLRLDRASVSGIAEVGQGYIQSQYDAGGYLVPGPEGSDQYKPAWVPLSADGVGGALGAMLGVNVTRWLLVESSVTWYAFAMPDHAQPLPARIVGVGIRLAG